jgi:hypothetical protein
VALEPEHADARLNLACLLLRSSQMEPAITQHPTRLRSRTPIRE